MPPFQLTPAQLALQAERKALKEAKKAAAKAKAGTDAIGIEGPGSELDDRSQFLYREWVTCREKGGDVVGHEESASGSSSGRTTRIVTWNILAQTLVRRELFPGSDCLRWADRKAMLLAELGSYSAADIICLQECDRLSDLAKALPTHMPIDTKGRGKVHGLVVLYRTDRYKLKARHTVYLDEEKIQDRAGREGRGGSRQTKNVGLIVGLEEEGKSGKGIVVCTTHLFWHPKFAYERVRQSVLLVRAIRRFQRENDCEDWPAVLAGDLNTQPSEATYQLLVSPGSPLHPKTINEVNVSRLVHTSVDNIEHTIPSDSLNGGEVTGTSTEAPTVDAEEDKDDEGEAEGELPDHDERSIANTRPPRVCDGIVELDELVRMMCEVLPGGARSALGSVPASQSKGEVETENERETFGTRGGLDGMEGKGHGRDEPAYTCFTPLFKLTLDYIFILTPVDERNITPRPSPESPEVIEHLRQARISELGIGLPRKGICASDHLAVGCGIIW